MKTQIAEMWRIEREKIGPRRLFMQRFVDNCEKGQIRGPQAIQWAIDHANSLEQLEAVAQEIDEILPSATQFQAYLEVVREAVVEFEKNMTYVKEESKADWRNDPKYEGEKKDIIVLQNKLRELKGIDSFRITSPYSIPNFERLAVQFAPEHYERLYERLQTRAEGISRSQASEMEASAGELQTDAEVEQADGVSEQESTLQNSDVDPNTSHYIIKVNEYQEPKTPPNDASELKLFLQAYIQAYKDADINKATESGSKNLIRIRYCNLIAIYIQGILLKNMDQLDGAIDSALAIYFHFHNELDVIMEKNKALGLETSIERFYSGLVQFLRITFNFNESQLDDALIADAIEKRKIDPYYLPNALPTFVSEPEIGEGKKIFHKRRIGEHMHARLIGKTIGLYGRNQQESISKEAVAFHQAPPNLSNLNEDTQKYIQEHIVAPNEQFYREIEASTATLRTQEGTEETLPWLDYSEALSYHDQQQRQQYRKFIYEGRLYQRDQEQRNRESLLNSFAVRPASTARESSKGKEGLASLVINGRGEIYVGSHLSKYYDGNQQKEFQFHSSFMAGGPVMFAGEVGINNEGYLTALSNSSGHYRPTLRHMVAAYQFLKGKGVNFSHCTIHYKNYVENEEYKFEETEFEEYFIRRKELLHDAYDRQDKVEVSNLLEEGADFDPEKIHDVIHDAVVQEFDIDFIRMLVEKGFNVNIIASTGETPLTAAAKMDNWELCAKLIVLFGAHINMRNKDGETVLKIAEENNKADLLKEYMTKLDNEQAQDQQKRASTQQKEASAQQKSIPDENVSASNNKYAGFSNLGVLSSAYNEVADAAERNNEQLAGYGNIVQDRKNKQYHTEQYHGGHAEKSNVTFSNDEEDDKSYDEEEGWILPTTLLPTNTHKAKSHLHSAPGIDSATPIDENSSTQQRLAKLKSDLQNGNFNPAEFRKLLLDINTPKELKQNSDLMKQVNAIHAESVKRDAATIAAFLQQAFAAIKREELLDVSGYSKPDRCGTLSLSSKAFNALSHIIITDILSCETIEERVLTVEHYIEVGRLSYANNNFAGMLAIVAAFNHSAIARLQATFDGLSAHAKSSLAELNKQGQPVAPGSGIVTPILAVTLNSNKPVIPYIGEFQSALGVALEKMPETAKGNDKAKQRQFLESATILGSRTLRIFDEIVALQVQFQPASKNNPKLADRLNNVKGSLLELARKQAKLKNNRGEGGDQERVDALENEFSDAAQYKKSREEIEPPDFSGKSSLNFTLAAVPVDNATYTDNLSQGSTNALFTKRDLNIKQRIAHKLLTDAEHFLAELEEKLKTYDFVKATKEGIDISKNGVESYKTLLQNVETMKFEFYCLLIILEDWKYFVDDRSTRTQATYKKLQDKARLLQDFANLEKEAFRQWQAGRLNPKHYCAERGRLDEIIQSFDEIKTSKTKAIESLIQLNKNALGHINNIIIQEPKWRSMTSEQRGLLPKLPGYLLGLEQSTEKIKNNIEDYKKSLHAKVAQLEQLRKDAKVNMQKSSPVAAGFLIKEIEQLKQKIAEEDNSICAFKAKLEAQESDMNAQKDWLNAQSVSANFKKIRYQTKRLTKQIRDINGDLGVSLYRFSMNKDKEGLLKDPTFIENVHYYEKALKFQQKELKEYLLSLPEEGLTENNIIEKYKISKKRAGKIIGIQAQLSELLEKNKHLLQQCEQLLEQAASSQASDNQVNVNNSRVTASNTQRQLTPMPAGLLNQSLANEQLTLRTKLPAASPANREYTHAQRERCNHENGLFYTKTLLSESSFELTYADVTKSKIPAANAEHNKHNFDNQCDLIKKMIIDNYASMPTGATNDSNDEVVVRGHPRLVAIASQMLLAIGKQPYTSDNEPYRSTVVDHVAIGEFKRQFGEEGVIKANYQAPTLGNQMRAAAQHLRPI